MALGSYITEGNFSHALADQIWSGDFWLLHSCRECAETFLFRLHICEAELSPYTLVKVTYHNRLNAEADVGIELSSVKSNIKRFAKM